MKKHLTIAAISIIVISCGQTGSNRKPDVTAEVKDTITAEIPQIEFEKDTYNFGVISPGDKVTHVFKFKNIGQKPLIITNAQASCGCTVPEIPKAPLSPGETGNIKVVFHSKGKSGVQNAVVTIYSNGEPSIAKLYLTGEIKVKGQQ